jgi:hypothetical protein
MSTTTDFNITISLNGDKNVTLYAGDLDKIKASGLHFELPPSTTVDVGSLKDFIDWLNGKLGANGNIPDASDKDWAAPIKNIFDGVLNAKMSVTKFDFDQGGMDTTTKKYPDPTFSLAVTGTFMDADGKTQKPIQFGDVFSVVGGGIGVTKTNDAS